MIAERCDAGATPRPDWMTSPTVGAWQARTMPVVADSEKPAPAREEVKDIVGRLVEGIKADDVSGLAAEIAYRFLFAVFPFGLFVAVLGSFAAGWLHVENPAQMIVAVRSPGVDCEP